MSEYLTLSGPGAVSLLSPESASVNSSSVIMSSFEPASVRVLSSPSQTAFLSSRLFLLLCWTKRWSSAEPFSLLVFSTDPLASMRSGVWDGHALQGLSPESFHKHREQNDVGWSRPTGSFT